MQGCKHFRYEVPREIADALRDADPEPCPICDALPHRKLLLEHPAHIATVRTNAPSPVVFVPTEIHWFPAFLTLLRRRKNAAPANR